MGMRQYRGWGIMMWQIKYKWSFEVAPAQAQIRHLLYFSHLMPKIDFTLPEMIVYEIRILKGVLLWWLTQILYVN